MLSTYDCITTTLHMAHGAIDRVRVVTVRVDHTMVSQPVEMGFQLCNSGLELRSRIQTADMVT